MEDGQQGYAVHPGRTLDLGERRSLRYWLILPRYPGTALEVSQLDINTSEARLVYSDPDCEALILQCNISDIFPDAEIRLRCEEGEAEFSPYISLRDGSVVLGPEGLDLTRE